MAFEVLDEHEQGEVVRKWLRANAMSIAIGIAIGLLMIFGWQQWKARDLRAQGEAAVQYKAFTDAVEGKRDDDVTSIAAALRKDHAKSPFAVFAALHTAEKAAGKGDFDAAAADLQWAQSNVKDESIKALASLRLARVTLAKGDADAALKLADGVKDASYAATRDELRGDALARLGRADEARTAYTAALEKLDAMTPGRDVVEMKLADLPASAAPAAPAATPAPAEKQNS